MSMTEQNQENPSILQRFRAAAKAFGNTRFGGFLNRERWPLLFTAATIGTNAIAPWGAGAILTGAMVGLGNVGILLARSRPEQEIGPAALSLLGLGVFESGMLNSNSALPLSSALLSKNHPSEICKTVSIPRKDFLSRIGLGLDQKIALPSNGILSFPSSDPLKRRAVFEEGLTIIKGEMAKQSLRTRAKGQAPTP